MQSANAPLTIQTDVGAIQIAAEPGYIYLNASELRARWGTDFLDRLLEHAVVSNAIDSISLDREQGTATIQYDLSRWDLPQALTAIGSMLSGSDDATPDRSEVSLNLSSIPGVVTRVDRVRTFTGADSGERGRLRDWFARLSPFGRKSDGQANGDRRLRTNSVMQGIIIHYAPSQPDAENGESTAEEIGDGNVPVDAELIDSQCALKFADDSHPLPGWKRVANLAAAGGCFLLSIVGFVTPGIPTLPFVLATSHFLVRSTPALNEKLRASWLFGAIVRDWEDQGGMRQSTKVRTLVVMFGLLGTTALLSGGSLPVLMMTSAVGGIDLLVILAIPTIADDREQRPVARLEFQPLVA